MYVCCVGSGYVEFLPSRIGRILISRKLAARLSRESFMFFCKGSVYRALVRPALICGGILARCANVRRLRWFVGRTRSATPFEVEDNKLMSGFQDRPLKTKITREAVSVSTDFNLSIDAVQSLWLPLQDWGAWRASSAGSAWRRLGRKISSEK